MSPTEMQIHARHKAFHAAIARRAAELTRKPVPMPAAPKPIPELVPATSATSATLPPIPNELMAEAVEMVFGEWRGSILKIQLAVCKEFGLTMTDLCSERRVMKIVRPRQYAIYICNKLTKHPISEITRRFGKRDHSTGIWAVERTEQMMASDPVLRERIDTLMRSLAKEVE